MRAVCPDVKAGQSACALLEPTNQPKKRRPHESFLVCGSNYKAEHEGTLRFDVVMFGIGEGDMTTFPTYVEADGNVTKIHDWTGKHVASEQRYSANCLGPTHEPLTSRQIHERGTPSTVQSLA